MLDHKMWQMLNLLEMMTNKQKGYYTTAVLDGKLEKIDIKFDLTKDDKGVTTFVQHIVGIEYKKGK